MEKRRLGSTGLFVTIIGFQAGHIGDRAFNDKTAQKVLNSALDMGINLIDTSGLYGCSEERIGNHLSKRRNEFILSIKAATHNKISQDIGKNLISDIEQSLKLLKTDHIDIFQLHHTPIEQLSRPELFDALEKCIKAGKILFTGYSGENEPLEYAVRQCNFDLIETSVNICDQKVIDRIFPIAKTKGMGIIARRPLANAFWESRNNHEKTTEEYRRRASVMDLHPSAHTWSDYAMKFTAYTPGIDALVVGTVNPDHLKDNIRAVESGPLSERMYRDIRNRFKLFDNGWLGLN